MQNEKIMQIATLLFEKKCNIKLARLTAFLFISNKNRILVPIFSRSI